MFGGENGEWGRLKKRERRRGGGGVEEVNREIGGVGIIR